MIGAKPIRVNKMDGIALGTIIIDSDYNVVEYNQPVQKLFPISPKTQNPIMHYWVRMSPAAFALLFASRIVWLCPKAPPKACWKSLCPLARSIMCFPSSSMTKGTSLLLIA